MRDKKTDEYIIRSGVVSQLLSEDWRREDIRIEIPMSTNSSGGRADIVCLSDEQTSCIELKSGKDILESDKLQEQIRQYERSFDVCAVVADASLYRCVQTITQNGMSESDNFRHVDLAFSFDWFSGKPRFSESPRKGYSKPEPPAVDKITARLFTNQWRSSNRKTSVLDMAQVLWADELRQILGKGTKYSLEQKANENMSVGQFRPLFIQALRERPLNEWETAFWGRFDREKDESPRNKALAALMR